MDSWMIFIVASPHNLILWLPCFQVSAWKKFGRSLLRPNWVKFICKAFFFFFFAKQAHHIAIYRATKDVTTKTELALVVSDGKGLVDFYISLGTVREQWGTETFVPRFACVCTFHANMQMFVRLCAQMCVHHVGWGWILRGWGWAWRLAEGWGPRLARLWLQRMSSVYREMRRGGGEGGHRDSCFHSVL